MGSPAKCIMKPKFAAMSYMRNQGCAGIPAALLPEFKREEEQCLREVVIPTPILSLWKRIQSLNKPVVSAHMVETQNSQICISKQKIRACTGQSEVSSEGLTSSKPLSLKTKMVEYACVSKGTSKGESLKKRAKSGESLSVELSRMPIAYSKVEAEPVVCVPAKSAGIGGSRTGGSGIGGGYGSGSGSGSGSSHGRM